MPKKILEDIKPLTRTRRNTVAIKRTKSPNKEDVVEEESYEPEEMNLKINTYDSNVSFDNSSGGTKRLSVTLWIITAAALLFLFIVLSSVFAKAKVEIKPKMTTGGLDATFVAKKDTTEELGYQIMSISDEVSENITSSKKETVENKAKGTVIIYNEFSATGQNLLIDTRLEATDGKIYKTEKAVTVPGFKKNGTEIIPGSIEIAVYADVAGIEYNKNEADFKIFGFKSNPTKYQKFYARTKTPITGGFSGERYVIDQEKAEETANNLRESLITKLSSGISNQIPEGYIVFEDGFEYEIQPIDKTSIYGTTEDFEVVLKGSVLAYIFEERQLAGEIAKILSSQYDGSPVFISNVGETKMELDPGNVSDSKSIKFKLVGEPTITWVVEEEAVRNALIGSTRKEFLQILSTFVGVDSGKVTISPFWKKTFPKNSKKIQIDILE